MRPTMTDHASDPLKFPACMAGCVWRQAGNITGHCAACHNTFAGLDLFDRHQRINDNGTVTCLEPAGMVYKGVELELDSDGTWRGPRMDTATKVKRFG